MCGTGAILVEERMTAYLAIDTSTRHGAVGLWRGGGLSRAAFWRSRNNHTAELMPAIERLTAEEGVAPSDLDGVVVAVGPGGFSALRTGIGVAQGFAAARGLPVAGVSALEASAHPYRAAAERVCAVLPAGRGAVAWAVYEASGGEWRALGDEQVSDDADFVVAQSGGELFCGEGLPEVADALRERFGSGARIVEESAPLARLGGVAALGAALLDAGETGLGPVPRYLRPPRITPPNAPLDAIGAIGVR